MEEGESEEMQKVYYVDRRRSFVVLFMIRIYAGFGCNIREDDRA